MTTIWPTPEDRPRRDPAPPPTPATDRAAGSTARQVAERLCADGGVVTGSIDVDVHDGVAMLRGTVGSPAQKEAAGQAARAVPGVRDVCNMLACPAAGAGRHPPSAFDAIAANLLADTPSLARPVREPLTPSARVALLVGGALAWGLFSVVLVMTGWPGLLVGCAFAAVAVEVVMSRRRTGRRPASGRDDRPA